MDVNYVHLNTMPKVYEYINNSTGKKQSSAPDNRQELIEEMREWYYRTSKHYLGRLLAYYNDRDQIINSYYNVVNINNNHWICLKVKLPPATQSKDKSLPSVTSIDNLHGNTDTEEASDIRRSYAKFFGLYYKERICKQELEDSDFDGHDLIADLENNGEEGVSKGSKVSSLLSHSAATVHFHQTDMHNCGVIALYQCISAMKQDNEFEERMQRIVDSEDDDDDIEYEFEKLRLELLDIIADVWNTIHWKRVRVVSDHFMLYSDEDELDIDKWVKCHELFESGKYVYKTEGSEICNANHLYKKRSKKEIEAELSTKSSLSDDSDSDVVVDSDSETASDKSESSEEAEFEGKNLSKKRKAQQETSNEDNMPKKKSKRSKNAKEKQETKKEKKIAGSISTTTPEEELS